MKTTQVKVQYQPLSYWIPVRRDMSFLLTDEVLQAFSWRDDTEDRSDYQRELEEC